MTRFTRSFLVAAMAVVGLIAAQPQTAEARGRFGFRGGIVFRGFYGAPYYGYGPNCGFGPYWGPCYGFAQGTGFDMGMAAAAGIGAVDLNVKPGKAEVWVDGRFVAEAQDLDGTPGYLWLREGPHHVVIYHGGYTSFEEDIAVPLGRKLDLKVRLDKGDSAPPTPAPKAPAAKVYRDGV